MSFLEMHRDVLAGGGNAATYEQGFNVLRTIDLIETGTTIFGGENI
jgi:hypothetical protein